MPIDERLLVKAPPALLEGWTGPVLTALASWGEGVWDRRLVWSRDDPMAEDGEWRGGARLARSIWLDLRIAACRDYVARVLTSSADKPCGNVFKLAYRDLDSDLRTYNDQPEPSWVVVDYWGEQYVEWYFADADGTGFDDSEVFEDIDPYDLTTLPDGSMLFEALALAALARERLHVP